MNHHTTNSARSAKPTPIHAEPVMMSVFLVLDKTLLLVLLSNGCGEVIKRLKESQHVTINFLVNKNDGQFHYADCQITAGSDRRWANSVPSPKKRQYWIA